MDSLQALPRDTAKLRNILFTLPLPFSLNTANYKLFWPLIDNVYSIRSSRDTNRLSNYRYHYVICRYKRARDTLPASSQSSQRASTTKRSIKSCDVSFVIKEFVNHVEFYYVEGNRDCRHDHSLDESDANKRNSLLKGLVQRDITRGYVPVTIISIIRSNGRADIRIQLASVSELYLTR